MRRTTPRAPPAPARVGRLAAVELDKVGASVTMGAEMCLCRNRNR